MSIQFRERAGQHLARGRLYYAEGLFDEARAELEAACELCPEWPEPYSALGALLLDSDELIEARRALEHAADLGMDDPGSLRALAETCCRMGAYADAARHYSRAADRTDDAPSSLRMRVNAALCRTRSGDVAQAEKDLLSLHEGNLGESLVTLALAQVLAHRPGGRARATELLAGVLEREPHHLMARYDLGLLLVRGKSEEPALRAAAVAHLERLMETPGFPELVPDAHVAHFALGTCYDDDPNGYESAARHYRAALAIRQDFPPALCNLGVIQERLGNRAQALTLYARALRVDPRFEPAAGHLARLCMEAEEAEAADGLSEALDMSRERALATCTFLRAVEDRAHADGQVALCEAVHRVKNRAGVLAARVKALPTQDCPEADASVPGVLELADMIFDDLSALLAVLRPVEDDAEVVDANTVIRRTCAMVRAWVPEGIAVSCATSETALPIRVDRERVRDLLTHLARNAVSSMSEGGELCLVCAPGTQGPGWVALQVRDSGEGIPAGSIEDVVKPGVSLRSGGSGLGLWICGRIARAHGGILRLESAEGEGTVATLELPPPEHPSLASRSLRLHRSLMALATPQTLELTDEDTPPRLAEGAGPVE